MLYGIIHTVQRDKGYAFIRPDRGPDVFFMLAVVDEAERMYVHPRKAVAYELEKRKRDEDGDIIPDKGPRAKFVKLIEKIPGGVLPKDEAGMHVKHHPKSRMKKPTWRKKGGASS